MLSEFNAKQFLVKNGSRPNVIANGSMTVVQTRRELLPKIHAMLHTKPPGCPDLQTPRAQPHATDAYSQRLPDARARDSQASGASAGGVSDHESMPSRSGDNHHQGPNGGSRVLQASTAAVAHVSSTGTAPSHDRRKAPSAKKSLGSKSASSADQDARVSVML
jgi:hypothetical protein